MTASSWKWVLQRPVDELIRVLHSYVPTAPLTVQHSNCSCKSYYTLIKFVDFQRSFLHDGILFLKKQNKIKTKKLAFLGSTYVLSRCPSFMLNKGKPSKSVFNVEAYCVLFPSPFYVA